MNARITLPPKDRRAFHTMYYGITILAVICLSAGAIMAGPPAAPSIVARSIAPDSQVLAFEPSEWEVDLGTSYGNPFDPGEIAVDARFTAPNGRQLTIPAFWYQPPDAKTSSGAKPRIDHPAWLVRFTPTQPGRWSCVVMARDRNGLRTSQSISFDVASSTNPGFICRSQFNSAYLCFESGKSFFPVGPNLAWPANQSYGYWFSKIAAAGCNYARVWLAPKAIETKQTGAGRYDQNRCAYFDSVLQLAQQHGIHLMLSLSDYRDVVYQDYWGAGGWTSSPYNAANGGPAATAQEFFASPTARALYRQRLRYLVARYSAYTSLAFWEIWNEQDHIAKPGVPLDWMREMTGYLRKTDPYAHLITTSLSWESHPELWQLDLIDMTQEHFYGDGNEVDQVPRIASNAAGYAQFSKPHLIGEYGATWKEPDGALDRARKGVALHNALWASVMTGSTGVASTWWWENYVDPNNLWGSYTSIARFVANVDWPRRQFRPIDPAAVQLSKGDSPISALGASAGKPGLIVLGLQDAAAGECLLWIYDQASNWKNDAEGVQPLAQGPLRISLPMASTGAGNLQAQWYDTRSGEVISTQPVHLEKGKLLFVSPEFVRDIAAHITRVRERQSK